VTKYIDMAGQIFGELKIVTRAGQERRYITWNCTCSCGKAVVVRGDQLRFGLRKKCGPEHPKIDHSLTRSSWKHMHQRCDPETGKYTKHGITVCQRWQSFDAFLEDMGPRPGRQYSIERTNNNGNYEPDNCKWALDDEQRRNTRRSRYVEWEGKQWFLVDLCRHKGLHPSVVTGRLNLGWSLENALTTPVRP
jgi:hypothetical protein